MTLWATQLLVNELWVPWNSEYGDGDRIPDLWSMSAECITYSISNVVKC